MASYHAPTARKLPSGTLVPACIYGTADKKDAQLILAALEAGFRGLDTASQGFYDEQAVGDALQIAFAPKSQGGLGLQRCELYIQTKFTTPAGHKAAGQASAAPYEAHDSIPEMVSKSLKTSLERLRVDYIDTLLLHGPMPTMEETLDVWKAMEDCVGHAVRNIGLSNMALAELQTVCSTARVPPAVVQNRFWQPSDYDRELREYCSQQTIVYQAFCILTGNPKLLDSALIGWLADRTFVSREDALFALVLSLDSPSAGVCILDGTRNASRMKETINAVTRLGTIPDFIKHGFQEQLSSHERNV